LYSFKQSSLCFYMRTERVVGWINKFELPKIHTPVKIAKHQIKRSSTKCYIKEHTNTMMKTNKGKKKIEMANNILKFLISLWFNFYYILWCSSFIMNLWFYSASSRRIQFHRVHVGDSGEYGRYTLINREMPAFLVHLLYNLFFFLP
jgi:hypothetical protein